MDFLSRIVPWQFFTQKIQAQLSREERAKNHPSSTKCTKCSQAQSASMEFNTKGVKGRRPTSRHLNQKLEAPRACTTANSLQIAAGDTARLVKLSVVGWSRRSERGKCNVVVTTTPNREDLLFQAPLTRVYCGSKGEPTTHEVPQHLNTCSETSIAHNHTPDTDSRA